MIACDFIFLFITKGQFILLFINKQQTFALTRHILCNERDMSISDLYFIQM